MFKCIFSMLIFIVNLIKFMKILDLYTVFLFILNDPISFLIKSLQYIISNMKK